MNQSAYLSENPAGGAPPASSGARAWSDPRITPEERRIFLEDIAAPDNLRRAAWLLAIYLPITAIALLLSVFSFRADDLSAWAYVDLVCSSSFLCLVLYLLRRGPAIRWKRRLLVVFYIYNVGLMEAYYFTALPRFGETSYYLLGLFMMALLIRLPPRQFIPLLLAAHVVYMTVLWGMVSGDAFVSGTFSGTNALILAGMASWFLFHRDWEAYEKSQVILRRNRALATANARLNELTAIAAHDLRGPLASLVTYTDLLQTEPEWQGEPYAEVLRDWRGVLDSQLHLINRVLQAHRVESTEAAPASLQTVAIAPLIERSLALLRLSAENKEIPLTSDTDKALQIETVPGLLEQALDNLVGNAIKFSPPGAPVHVTARRLEGQWEITVQDAGPGIPASEAPRLFHKFHHGPNQPTGDEKSSGLGLFIVRQLITTLGGAVTYEPAQPTGSRFRILLPLKAPPAKEEEGQV